MKQEHLIFIILLIAAAVVLGTTFGIVNGYMTVVVQQKLNTESKTTDKQGVSAASAQEKEKEKAASEKTSAPAEKEQTTDTGTVSTPETVDPNHPSTTIDYNNAPVGESPANRTLTAAETEQVAGMFIELGYPKGDLTENIKSFQKKNGITVTGKLDEITLGNLIQQVTVKRAKKIS